MNKLFMSLWASILLTPLPNFGKRRNKCPAPINYQGTLTTLRDHEYPISNISINHKQHCIPVFRAPCNTNTIVTTLSYNPKSYVDYINLADIAAIEMPYPYAQWTYCSCNNKRKEKYVLIKVIWIDEKKTACHFLIQPRRRLTARVHKKIRSTDSQLPFRGFKKITIEA